MKKIIALLILVVVLAAVAWASEASLKVGSPAPELRLTSLSGAAYDLNSAKGKTVILSFFTTWSRSCLDQLKFLSALNEKHPGLDVVAVSFDNKSSLVKSFLEKNALAITALIDKKHKYLDEFHILIIPTAFLIDSSGVLRNIYVDFDETIKESIIADVNGLLAPRKAD
ncbi:MAG: TlpA disulfide reductase family protein [Candidatus Margulisiibacteriota bacterium]